MVAYRTIPKTGHVKKVNTSLECSKWPDAKTSYLRAFTFTHHIPLRPFMATQSGFHHGLSGLTAYKLGQIYSTQAHEQKENHEFDLAIVLFTQAKDAFKKARETKIL